MDAAEQLTALRRRLLEAEEAGSPYPGSLRLDTDTLGSAVVALVLAAGYLHDEPAPASEPAEQNG